MSLFPAYDKNNLINNPSTSSGIENIDKNDLNWLENSSFQPEIIPQIGTIIISSDSSDCEFIEEIPDEKIPKIISLDSEIEEIENKYLKKSKKSKKNKSNKIEKKIKLNYEPIVENIYFDDKIRDKGNFKVSTLCSRARPLYNRFPKTLGFISSKSNKKESLKRYYAATIFLPQNLKKKELKKLKKHSIFVNNDLPEIDESFKKIKEEEIKLKIKEFNEKLSENPQNIDIWIEYINFDETNDNLPKNKKKEILNYQRKLSIAEKALEKNPNSILLLKLKLKILNELLPADQYSYQLESLITKDSGNIILWQSLITSTRSSVSLCTTPKIIELYVKCFGTLHLWSRILPKNYDKNLLIILFECLTFLRHSGLWEQMWEALRMNLTLNLSINNEMKNFKGSIDEKKLIGMEELILTSQLPLNQLWLRVELLRENCHWITVEKEELEFIGDSHRFITPEDVTELIHPLLKKESNFRMSILSILILKIPILPARHWIFNNLKIENWTIDSIEYLIPMFFPFVGEIAGYEMRNLLFKGLIEAGITSGPQYLKFHPARDGYIDFVRNSFKIIGEKLELDERNGIYIWWLRFERIILKLQKLEGIKNDKNYKKLKGILKDFLKKEENRNNLDFYREYAIIEKEMGKWENCLNILNTAIENRENILLNIKNIYEQKAIVSLYKTLIETLLDIRNWKESNKFEILKIFMKMSEGTSDEEKLLSTGKYLENFYFQFIESTEIFEEICLENYFQNNHYYDTIMCYIYLLYITDRDLDEIYEIFQKCIEKSNENPFIQELFYEGEIIFRQLIYEKFQGKINDLQKRVKISLEKFPDNFYLLSVSAGIESELPTWCSLTSTRNKGLWPTISSCLSGRARLNSEICQRDETAMTGALNKLIHFHKRLSNLPEIRCCPLIWRLYMLLLREQNLSEQKGEEVYHESVASCPWARCIYIDAAQIVPQHLTQIQDVIKEKDLRMYVTPEELDILRG